MAFQFYCPQQHLLQADESQAGQQSTCPTCGTTFVIPAPAGAQPETFPQMGGQFPQMGPQFPQEPSAPATNPIAAMQQAAEPAPPPAPEQPAEPRVFRIACPSGHVLETPSDMLGQHAMCPYCNVQFELRYEDSEEYRAEQVVAEQKRQEELNQKWVQRSIKLAIFVGVMFVLMILYIVIDSLFIHPG